MKRHLHEVDRTCCCSSLALEPDEDCPVHGGCRQYPPKCCICGKFFKVNIDDILNLENVFMEAVDLLSKHDGMHNMHGDYAGIQRWLRNAESGLKIDWDNVNYLIKCMRLADKLGHYPKRNERSFK